MSGFLGATTLILLARRFAKREFDRVTGLAKELKAAKEQGRLEMKQAVDSQLSRVAASAKASELGGSFSTCPFICVLSRF